MTLPASSNAPVPLLSGLVLAVCVLALPSAPLLLARFAPQDAGTLLPATFAATTLVAVAVAAVSLLRGRHLARDLAEMATVRGQAVKAIRSSAEENAHALKTPIATIGQALEPLWRRVRAGDDALLRPVELIDQATAKLTYLVGQARALEESTADLLAGRFAPVDLTFLLVGTGLDMRDVLEEDGIKLAVEVDKGLTVRGREEGLRTAIDNLLENAAGFSPQGGTIHLTGRRRGGTVEVTVEDEGPGCHPDLLPRLFGRYFSHRAGAASEPGAQSDHAGIGLWIVKRNVEAMGGQVHAGNRSEGGLRVTLRLPV